MNERLDLSKYQDKKLIAFDLYGTCVDHPNKIFRLSGNLRDILKTRPISLLNGDEIENNGEKIKVSEEFIDMIRKDIEGTFLFQDTLETLKYIKDKGYQTAVVSNLSKDYAEPLYRLIPNLLFDHKILSFDVGAIKPDPKIYEELRTKSGIDFKDMIMIGDSLKADVLGPNNVGITPIYLRRNEEGGIEEKGIKEVKKLGIKVIQISTLADLIKIL